MGAWGPQAKRAGLRSDRTLDQPTSALPTSARLRDPGPRGPAQPSEALENIPPWGELGGWFRGAASTETCRFTSLRCFARGRVAPPPSSRFSAKAASTLALCSRAGYRRRASRDEGRMYRGLWPPEMDISLLSTVCYRLSADFGFNIPRMGTQKGDTTIATRCTT